jgi:ribonuclease HI
MYSLYTDGSCDPNPGDGGWGFCLKDPDDNTILEDCGFCPASTNNRMELKAAIEGLRQYIEYCLIILDCKPDTIPPLMVYSDSDYLVKGITLWMGDWVRNNWKSKRNQPIQNRDLWEELCGFTKEVSVTWEHVKAHNGNVGNERADKLALQGRMSQHAAQAEIQSKAPPEPPPKISYLEKLCLILLANNTVNSIRAERKASLNLQDFQISFPGWCRPTDEDLKENLTLLESKGLVTRKTSPLGWSITKDGLIVLV